MHLNCPQCQSENTQKIIASVGVMGGSIGVGSSSGRISATSSFSNTMWFCFGLTMCADDKLCWKDPAEQNRCVPT